MGPAPGRPMRLHLCLSATSSLFLAGCIGAADPSVTGLEDATQDVGSCGPPVILSPTAGQVVGTTVSLRTSAPACLIATKCYVDGNPTPVASHGAGGLTASVRVPLGHDQVQCNGWDSRGIVYKSGAVAFTSATHPPDAGGPPDAGAPDGGSCHFDVPLASLTGHNTSASATYDQSHFGANFGTSSWVSQSGATVAVDSNRMDKSMNPITPGHVSGVDVHTLIPSRPDLRWFAHSTPWFRLGGFNHIDIGVQSDSVAYAQAMVDDMRRRGFDGVIVDWYGQGSFEDNATLQFQKYIDTLPAGAFKLILMMDKGIPGLSQSVLEQQIRYVQSQYFSHPSYELEGGKPILMFFGVTDAIGASAMAAAKSATGGNMIWVVQGTGSLGDSWVDQSFDWTHDFTSGDSPSDPYNLAGVAGYYAAVGNQGKKAFGSMAAGFNGTLTKSVGWSMGKYLPRGNGACIVKWAEKINSVIPSNITRMQWATWSDWEEGTQIESGVENDASVSASAQGSTLSWAVSAGTGDESTIDHYEVYASANGVEAAALGAVPAGTHSMDLASSCLVSGQSYQVSVVAVGKPNIRDHASAAVAYAR
jgi:hypothetical protein